MHAPDAAPASHAANRAAGGESVECFTEIVLRKSASASAAEPSGPRSRVSKSLSSRRAVPNCTKVIGTPISTPAVHPRYHTAGFRGRRRPSCAKFFNVCRGCVFVFRSRFFSGARGRSGVVPRVRLERVKTSRDAMRIAGRLARRVRAPDASRIAIGDAKTRVARRGKAPARGSFRDGARKIFFGGTPRDAPAAP